MPNDCPKPTRKEEKVSVGTIWYTHLILLNARAQQTPLPGKGGESCEKIGIKRYSPPCGGARRGITPYHN